MKAMRYNNTHDGVHESREVPIHWALFYCALSTMLSRWTGRPAALGTLVTLTQPPDPQIPVIPRVEDVVKSKS